MNANVDGSSNTAVGVGALRAIPSAGDGASVVKRSQAKPAAATARLSVTERSQVRPTARPILPPGLWRSKIPRAHAIRPSVLQRSATALPATTSPWAQEQAPMSPRLATLSVSAPMVTTWQQLLYRPYLRCNLFRRNGSLYQFNWQTWHRSIVPPLQRRDQADG